MNGTSVCNFNGHEIDWAKFQRLSMREAIIAYWPQNAGAKPEMSDFASGDKLQEMIRRYNAQNHPHIPYDPEAPAGKKVAEIFEYVAEPHLFQPTFIYDFPLAISPLSKNKREPEENADWVERFEIFVGGSGDRQRLQRAERSGRTAPAL